MGGNVRAWTRSRHRDHRASLLPSRSFRANELVASVGGASRALVADGNPERRRDAAREILPPTRRLRRAIDMLAYDIGVATTVRGDRPPHAPIVSQERAAPAVLGSQ